MKLKFLFSMSLQAFCCFRIFYQALIPSGLTDINVLWIEFPPDFFLSKFVAITQETNWLLYVDFISCSLLKVFLGLGVSWLSFETPLNMRNFYSNLTSPFTIYIHFIFASWFFSDSVLNITLNKSERVATYPFLVTDLWSNALFLLT